MYWRAWLDKLEDVAEYCLDPGPVAVWFQDGYVYAIGSQSHNVRGIADAREDLVVANREVPKETVVVDAAEDLESVLVVAQAWAPAQV
jgi:hypothetical protein